MTTSPRTLFVGAKLNVFFLFSFSTSWHIRSFRPQLYLNYIRLLLDWKRQVKLNPE